MPDSSKTFAGVAASSAAWGWLHRKPSIKNRKSLCHCERSEAISLHHSLFLVRHSIFTTTFTFLLVLFLIASPAYAKYGGGTGEPNDPYLIYDANQMNAIGTDSNDWDKHFLLCADIDLSAFTGTSFNIIGELYYDLGWIDNPFTGVFDGNGHTISNFTYTSTGTNYIALFGYVDDPNVEIKDLGLIDPNVDAGTGNYVGSLVGCLSNGTITGCYVQGGSVSGRREVGGLVGRNYGSINNCYAIGSVSGDYPVGGLVGLNYYGTISNSYSTGSASGVWYVGGLVGYNQEGTITNCYSAPSVSGNFNVGGLVGKNYRGKISDCYSAGSIMGDYKVGGLVGRNEGRGPWLGTIANCYSTGDVSGTEDVGGLVGYNKMGDVTTSFWDIETSGQTTSAGGKGKTTAQMQTMSTFIDWVACESVWTIDEGADYPRLAWQNAPGEPLGLGGGTGTEADPYLIYTAEQLNTIAMIPCDLGKHFKLMADIDLTGLTGTSFNIIGTAHYKPFTGVFDGSGHTISNFSYTSTYEHYIGLFGYVMGEVRDLGLIDPDVDVAIGGNVGSLVGYLKDGTITNCYVEGGTASGRGSVGGLVGSNSGTITNCYSTARVSGTGWDAGGLVGQNDATISNSYSTGSVSGDKRVGGLVGYHDRGTINNCFSTGGVSGIRYVGGLVGYNELGEIIDSFWDIEISRQTTSDGGTGKTTAEMQTMSTFTDAGWDFTTPVWTIDDGVDYPRLWWELAPVLHAEPEVTLGTSNTISWEPVAGDVEYYAECAEDANFTNIIYNTGWITETNYTFTGLELGQVYWYSVKARNSAGIESGWSNVESSLQVTLADAVDMMLDPDTLKNKNMKNALLNKINTMQQMLDMGRYEEALNKLQNDILQKTDG